MMKKVISTLLAGAIGVSMMVPAFAAEESVKIYVSATKGNDDNNGNTLSSAVATPEKAQALAQSKKDSGKKIEVIFEGGEYALTNPLTFTEADSGTASAPVVYRAYQGADVKFTLATKLTEEDFTDAAGGIVQADVTDVPGIGELAVGFQDTMKVPSGMHAVVYQNGEMQQIASDTLSKDSFVSATNDSGESYYTITGDKDSWYENGTFWGHKDTDYSYSLSDVSNFKKNDRKEAAQFEQDPENAVMHMWGNQYTIQQVDGKWQFHASKFSPKSYNILNVSDGIDEPGEYYVDIEWVKSPTTGTPEVVSATLNYLPADDISTNPVYFSATASPVITLTNADYISFEGIDVFAARGNGFKLTGCDNVNIYDSIMTGFGTQAVYADTTTNLLVERCTIADTKAGAVFMRNVVTDRGHVTGEDEGVRDDQFNLVESNNTIRNSKIYDLNKVSKTGGAAVELGGVGAIVENCEIYDSPYMAIRFTGNNHQIKNNKIHDVIKEVWDSGAIYAMRSWIGRGTVIEGNYIYNSDPSFALLDKYDWYNGNINNQGIYIDDIQSGITVKNNVVANYSNGIMIGGGSDMVIENNTIVNCRRGIFYDNRGEKSTHLYSSSYGRGNTLKEIVRFLEKYDAASAEAKAKWDAYLGFTDMIARVRTFLEAEATGTALADLGRTWNTSVKNNTFTGSWAEWREGIVPEGAVATENAGEYYIASTDTYIRLNGTTPQLKRSQDGGGEYQDFPNHLQVYQAVTNTPQYNNTYTGNVTKTNTEANITVPADGYSITVDGVAMTEKGVAATDSYKPSYSPDEDGVNKGNKFTVVAAAYDENGTLKALNTTKEAYMYDGQLTNIQLDVPEGVNSNWQVKVLLWDSISGLTPLAAAGNPFAN